MDQRSDIPNAPAAVGPARSAAIGKSGEWRQARRHRVHAPASYRPLPVRAESTPDPPPQSQQDHRASEAQHVGQAAIFTGRRLAALAFLDVVGYARLMATDEAGTLRRWVDLRSGAIEPRVSGSRGRIVDRAGDGLFVEFRSVLDAVRWALDVQAALAVAPAAAEEPPLRVRVAVHLGDVIEAADGGVYGDAVNVAARLQERALPGGVVVSRAVHEQVRHLLANPAEDLGPLALKNLGRPVHAVRIGPAAPRQYGRVPPPDTAGASAADSAVPAPASPFAAATSVAVLLGAVVVLSAVEWPSSTGPAWAGGLGLVAGMLLIGPTAIRRAFGRLRPRRSGV